MGIGMGSGCAPASHGLKSRRWLVLQEGHHKQPHRSCNTAGNHLKNLSLSLKKKKKSIHLSDFFFSLNSNYSCPKAAPVSPFRWSGTFFSLPDEIHGQHTAVCSHLQPFVPVLMQCSREAFPCHKRTPGTS